MPVVSKSNGKLVDLTPNRDPSILNPPVGCTGLLLTKGLQLKHTTGISPKDFSQENFRKKKKKKKHGIRALLLNDNRRMGYFEIWP